MLSIASVLPSLPQLAITLLPKVSMQSKPLNERPALALEDVVYNVAIGSNMDGAKLRSRTVGDERRIKTLNEGVPCRVPGWSLSFDFVCMPPMEPLMCGAVAKEGEELHGVLWKLPRDSYELLARTEGCICPHSTYVETEVAAHPYDGTPPVRALVFALRRPEPYVPPHLYPSERYMKLMIEGSRGAKLAPVVLRRLEEMPTAPKCTMAMRVYSLFSFIATFFLFRFNVSERAMQLVYRPIIAALYSRREDALRKDRPLVGWLWTLVMVLAMLPLASLGFIVALFKGNSVMKMVKGIGIFKETKK